MRPKSINFFAAFAASIIVFTATVSGQKPVVAPTPTPTPAATPTLAANSGSIRTKQGKLEITFPEVENWEQSEVTTYPQAALGYSVSYDREGGSRVTVYVYNGGRTSIPDKLDGPVADQLASAKEEIKMVAEMGVYKNVKETKSNVKTLAKTGGKIAVVHAAYTLEARGTKLNSSIYVFPFKNNFIKLRITSPIETDESFEADMDALLAALDKLFGDAKDMEKTALR